MKLFSIVYTSKVRSDVAGEALPEIEEILANARRSNAERGVHGALLFTEGRFVQVLEGDRSVVEGIFNRILVDQRHHNIEVLCSQTTGKPRFADWSMAFVGDTPTLRERFADAPLADLASEPSGDALLDFMLDIARSPD